MTSHYDDPPYTPTPSEIVAARRDIQAGWSEQQERSRWGIRGGEKTYQFSVVDEAWLLGAMRQ